LVRLLKKRTRYLAKKNWCT